MANPSGKNGPTNFNGFVQNPPQFGDRQRMGDLQRTAPVAGAGAAASALNSPRRGQRRVVKGGQAASPPAPLGNPPAAVVVPPSLPYQQVAAQTWLQVASTPGASPLVQQYAQEAQLGGTG